MTESAGVAERLQAIRQQLYNLVSNLAHPSGDHRENPLEDEAHDLLRDMGDHFTAQAQALERLTAELRSVDMVLDRRDALAPFDDRVDKILHVITLAKVNDPKAELSKALIEVEAHAQTIATLQQQRDESLLLKNLEINRLEGALRSIAMSSCCGCCQEAALVAKSALGLQ
jgi:multidrug efflux pump subunit AcrA (membrane-fusion protein)